MKLKFLIAATATAILTAGAAQAAPAANGPGFVAPFNAVFAPAEPPLFEQAQYFYGGRDYCWYFDGWHGPGWYWCGYRLRRGFGWGGVDGFHGWYGHGHPNGWHGGGGYHGGGYHGGGYHGGGYNGGGRHGGGYHGGGDQGGGHGHAPPAFGGGHSHGGGHGGGHDGGSHGGGGDDHHH